METDLMVLAPHPDDAEIGMGGALAALSQAGRKIVVVDLTDGEPTPCGSHEKRLLESAAASKILGIEQRRSLDLPNRGIFDTAANRSILAELMREYRPKVLFAPYWEDAHPDHVNASQLADAARFYAKFVHSELKFEPYYPRKILYYFCVHLQPKIQPAFVFDISAQIEAKMEALKAYRSQFVDNAKNEGVFDKIRTFNAYWGGQVGCRYGEPFACRENIRISSPDSLLNI